MAEKVIIKKSRFWWVFLLASLVLAGFYPYLLGTDFFNAVDGLMADFVEAPLEATYVHFVTVLWWTSIIGLILIGIINTLAKKHPAFEKVKHALGSIIGQEVSSIFIVTIRLIITSILFFMVLNLNLETNLFHSFSTPYLFFTVYLFVTAIDKKIKWADRKFAEFGGAQFKIEK